MTTLLFNENNDLVNRHGDDVIQQKYLININDDDVVHVSSKKVTSFVAE